MPERYIPEHVDPFRYAEQSLALSGTLKIADMARLRTNVLSSDDRVHVDLQFGVDEQGIPFLKGRLTTKLVIQCQRCMQPFTYEIVSDFALGIVKTLNKADDLPKRYEPALTNEKGELALRELIEDEILLNLPIVPKHEPDDCNVKLPFSDSGEESKGENPFQVLQSLKHK